MSTILSQVYLDPLPLVLRPGWWIMTRYRSAITNMKENKFSCQVELEDNATYFIQGVQFTSFQLSLEYVLHVDEILYVLGLNKNLLFV